MEMVVVVTSSIFTLVEENIIVGGVVMAALGGIVVSAGTTTSHKIVLKCENNLNYDPVFIRLPSAQNSIIYTSSKLLSFVVFTNHSSEYNRINEIFYIYFI